MTTVTLKHPFEIGGRRVEEVHVRRVKMRDHKAIEKLSGLNRSFALTRNLTELTDGELEEMDHEDFDAIQDVILDFLGGPPTSES